MSFGIRNCGVGVNAARLRIFGEFLKTFLGAHRGTDSELRAIMAHIPVMVGIVANVA